MSELSFTQENSLESFDAQYRRVFEAAECKTQVELAELLEIRQSSISDAKRRESVPSEWIVKLFDKKRINPEWVRTGHGSKTLQIIEGVESKVPEVINIVERRPAQDCTTDELVAEIVRRVLKKIS